MFYFNFFKKTLFFLSFLMNFVIKSFLPHSFFDIHGPIDTVKLFNLLPFFLKIL